MTTSNQKFGNHAVTGNPKADWSHAASFLAGLHTKTLYGADLPAEDAPDLVRDFRSRLLKVDGIDQLSEDDLTLVSSLAESVGADISHLPGGENYRVSTESPDNPLGLPGDLWAAVTEVEDGALVAALVTVNDGELDVMVPGGRGWEPLNDLGVIDGYSLVGVTADAVDLYHNYDRDNTLGVISSYPIATTGPFPTEAQLSVPMPREIGPRRDAADEFWKNAGETPGQVAYSDEAMMASAVVIETEDDLQDAIAAAAADPDLRWYVERRVAALGIEASLPWLEV